MRDRFPPGTSLWALFEGAYKPLRLRGGSGHTVRQYKIQIGHLSRHLGRDATIGDLDDLTISAFLDERAESTSRANSNKARNHILALWRFAARKGIVAAWPDVDRLTEPERVPQAWTIDELGRLFSACASAAGKVGPHAAADYWLALHWLLWNTGERKGAALRVKASCIDIAAKTLTIPAEDRKGGVKAAVYQLWPETMAALASLVKAGEEFLFAVGGSEANFYRRYRTLLASAGLPHGRFCGPHRIRRTFASHIEASGGNATDALGHSSRAVTLRSYIDPRIAKRDSPADLLPRPKLPPEAA